MNGNGFTSVLLDDKVVFNGFSNTCPKPHQFHLHILGQDKQKIKHEKYDEDREIAVDLKDLFVGRTYLVKLEIVYAEDYEVFKTHEKLFTVGGERVARDVTVKLGQLKHRWIDVSFGPPKCSSGLLYYQICASADGGPTRVQNTKNLTMVMKYLKSDTTYNITVTSVYDEQGEGLPRIASTAEPITTDRSSGDGGKHATNVFNFESGNTHLNIGEANIGLQQTILSTGKSTELDFGMVVNLRAYFVKTNERNKVLLCLQWNQPSFSGHFDDYFIDYFQVEVFEEGGGIWGEPAEVEFEPEDYLTKYKWQVKVIGGKSYNIGVKTFYEDVETGRKYFTQEATIKAKSGLEMDIETKPPLSDITSAVVTPSQDPSTSRHEEVKPTLMKQRTEPKTVAKQGKIQRSKWIEKGKIRRGAFADFHHVSSNTISNAVKMNIFLDFPENELIEELARRMRTVVPLNHQRLLKYIEYIPEPPNYNIIMEYLDWQQLDEHINESSSGITEDEASTYTLQIVEGIEYLHQKDLIHGDVKCSKIWWKRIHGIKIGGFAVGKALKEKLSKTSLSSDGKFVQWSPEEIATGGNFIMMKSVDVWGIGCTVYEMITGKPPLYGKEWQERRELTVTIQIPQISWASDRLKEFLGKSMTVEHQRLSASELKTLPWIRKSLEPEAVENLQIDELSENNEYLRDYEKLDKIGRGRFGDVFKAKTKNGKLFAIKEYEVDQQDKEWEKKMREYKFAKKGRCHKHIIQFYACKEKKTSTGYKYTLAMELMKKSLSKEIREEKFSEVKTRIYAYQIMEGLRFLHSEGYIHRDIRGDNILISFEGMIKIADFGFVRELLHASEKNITQNKGTVRWMSPEAVEGSKPVTPKTDVWSLGCTIIEMLTGEPPFMDIDSDIRAKDAILYQNRRILGYIPTGISESLKELLHDVFEKDSDKRPHVYELLTRYGWMAEEL